MSYEITTPCGKIKGTEGRVKGVIAYKGIRYATAGRFEYPVQIRHWDGIYDATEYGNCAYQPRSFYNEEDVPEKAFYFNEFRRGETYTYSEDCLFLNVFVPENAKAGDKLPVLLYIHGGAFLGGCGHEKHFDCPQWPLHGVIGVTINYRLGPLGFMALPQLVDSEGRVGNYGLYDQHTAICWVKDNIKAFGGDPDKITIMGQSAGAMSVSQQCLSPLSHGLFRGAVMSSGCGVHKMMNCKARQEAYPFWQEFMKRCGCNTVEELKEASPEQIINTFQKIRKKVKGGGSALFPIIDNGLVVDKGTNIVARGEQMQIPYMCGLTSQDVLSPILYQMAGDWCKKQEMAAYGWFFDRQLPGDDCGAWHSSDLWYWFGTLDHSWRPFTVKDQELSRQMVTYLCNFVKTGNPNDDGLLNWQTYKNSGKFLLLGEKNTHMGNPSRRKLIWTMLTNKAVGE